MAKHQGRRRRRRGITALPFSASVALVTLADETVLATTVMGGVFQEDFFCVSIDAQWGLRGLTPGEGPIQVGYAHDNYSVTEVKESLEANLLTPDNKIQQERSRRLVRTAGKFPGVTAVEVLNDGKMIRTPLRFTVGNDHALEFWAKNRSGGTLTTGGIIELDGVLYGRWIR